MKFRHRSIKKRVKELSKDKSFFSKKEILLIIIFIVIGGLISFIPKIPSLGKAIINFFIFSIIIIVSISVKKMFSGDYAIKIEHDVFSIERYGFKEREKFKGPFKIGFLTILISIISLGYIKPLTFFQFECENIPEKRILKTSGSKRAVRKEEINEEDLANTSAYGFYALILTAIIGLFIKPIFPYFGFNLAKYSIYYGIWNMLPIGQLDGSKLFFGITIKWLFILIVYVILGLFIIFI